MQRSPAQEITSSWPRVVRGAFVCGAFAVLGFFFRGGFLAQIHYVARGWAHAAALGAAALGPLLICFRLILWSATGRLAPRPVPKRCRSP